MSSCQLSTTTSMTVAPTRSNDLKWAHRCIVLGERNSTQYVYCSKIVRGDDVTRLKNHLTEILENVKACKEVFGDIN